MLVPTFQHPCTNEEGEAIFHLLSCQVHGDGVSPNSSAKRSSTDPTQWHRKGNKWPRPCPTSVPHAGSCPGPGDSGRCPGTLFWLCS